MKIKLVFYGLIVLTIYGCKTSKKAPLPKGEINEAIHNAVVDFLHTESRLAKKESIFSLFVENVSIDVLGIGISAERDKISLFTENEIDYDYRFFPTRAYEYQNKLFYWKDSTINVSQEIVNKFYSLNKVDTTIYQKLFPVRTIDEKQKVVHYYYCKSNLNRYRKKKTSIAMFKYEIPKVECTKP